MIFKLKLKSRTEKLNTFELKKNLAQKKKYSKFTLLHSISVRVLIRLKIKDIFLSKSE